MAGLDRRVSQLEGRALDGSGNLTPRFVLDGDDHVSATMPGVGAIFRGPDETNTSFEQRVFAAVLEAASRGTIGWEHLSDETLKACMAAQALSADVLDVPKVRIWFELALSQREEGAKR